MVLFIAAASILHTMEKRSLNSSSGQRRILTKRLQCIYRGISKSIQLIDVKHVQMVVGGDHGNNALQFGASVLVELADNRNINFEVLVCKLICCKDTGRLLEETILERLTSGLEIIATFELHLFTDEGGSLVAKFCPHGQIQNPTTTSHTPITKVFVTGNLAFQAMALGKESMAGHWCMQCKANRLQFHERVRIVDDGGACEMRRRC
jgi:hypothetical protein